MRQEKSETRSKPISYETLRAAASGMGYPMELLKQAKNLGCPAFRGSRVYVDDFEKWVAENAEAMEGAGGNIDSEGKEELEKRKLRLQCQLLDIKINAERGDYIPKSILSEYVPRCMAAISDIGRKHLDAKKYNAFVREVKLGFEAILTPPLK